MRNSATQTERERAFATSTMVLRALPEAALITDGDGCVRHINPAAEALLGVQALQVLDQPLAHLPGGAQLVALAETAYGQYSLGEQTIAFRRQPLVAEEGERLIAGELILLQDVGPELELQRRQYDYLCRALHDVRVPLQAIGGAAEGLLRGWFGPLTDEQREFAGMIKENANHQGTLFAQIYDAYTLGYAIAQLQPEPISITGILQESEHELAERFAARPLSLTFELEAGLPLIQADRVRLRQVVLVLLNNALRYTFPEGTVRVQAFRDGDVVRVAVADTGVGIRVDDQPRIFTPFFRGENPLKEGRYGGLSLVIAQRIVQLHGGDIWFESVEGQGTMFSFSIPLAEGADAAQPE